MQNPKNLEPITVDSEDDIVSISRSGPLCTGHTHRKALEWSPRDMAQVNVFKRSAEKLGIPFGLSNTVIVGSADVDSNDVVFRQGIELD